MKIVYLVPYISQSGPLNVVNYLCSELIKKHEVDVYYFKNINNGLFPVETKRIDFFNKIDFDHYDIIHSHGVLPDAYIWWHRKSIKKAKTVTTLHNYVKEDYKYAYNPIKAFILERVWNRVASKHDVAVVLSKHAVEYYKSFWKNKNLKYVYNGIPCLKEDININLFTQDKTIKIGLIGSGDITKRKGFDQVIKAMEYLPDYSVYIAGRGQQVYNLKKLAQESKVECRVHFVGFQDDIISFIDTMDIFVVPSRSEGFSLVLQEVARQKKPAVCSEIPIFQELFSNSEVMFFKLEDIEDLVLAIEKTYNNKDAFGEKIFQKYLSSYTSVIMANNYLKLYQDTIENSPK